MATEQPVVPALELNKAKEAVEKKKSFSQKLAGSFKV